MMDQLEAAGDEVRLRELGFGDGDRCAFIRLIEILVDGDRLDDLRILARDGDGRAFTTLMELLFRTDRVDQLRAEADEFPSARLWLAQLHLRRGEVDAGLAELAAAELDPELGWSAHSERIAQLLRFGRVADVRAMAEAGDRVAGRRLRRFERESDRSQ
ncbi:hypothetical protein LZ318_17005 [Saccharopolyspora indica]|uniref:hypothetical protein n=1 Tax=Saccharopolyspora indica TaxID=1229659 RepID=UPI0022EA1DBB|nr:hypothetical protein [Saccharopolyspora indica]MDA3648620.1 hypothetical protein [Saccharopolyspora indica]